MKAAVYRDRLAINSGIGREYRARRLALLKWSLSVIGDIPSWEFERANEALSAAVSTDAFHPESSRRWRLNEARLLNPDNLEIHSEMIRSRDRKYSKKHFALQLKRFGLVEPLKVAFFPKTNTWWWMALCAFARSVRYGWTTRLRSD